MPKSYWARGRSYDVVARSVRESLTLGLYGPDGGQVGVCRWVTDYATFAWLCDVFVDGGPWGGVWARSWWARPRPIPTCGICPSRSSAPATPMICTDVGFETVAAPERWMERRR